MSEASGPWGTLPTEMLLMRQMVDYEDNGIIEGYQVAIDIRWAQAKRFNIPIKEN